MAEPIKIYGLAAALEGTYGTDEVPTAAANAIRLAEPHWATLRLSHAFENQRTEVANSSLLPAPPAPRKGRIVELDIPWEIKGGGSAYAAAADIEANALLQACGLAATVDATGGSESVTYAPASSGIPGATIYAWGGGMRFRIVGCRGNLVWPVTAGQNGMLRFQMRGMLIQDPDTQSLPSFTYNSGLPPAAVGMALTLDSWSPVFRSATLDMGSDVQQIDDGNGADGLHGFGIVEHLPTYSIETRITTLSDLDAYNIAKASTQGTIDQTLGDTQYNRLKLDCNDAYIRNPDHIDYNRYAGWNLQYELSDLSLIFD